MVKQNRITFFDADALSIPEVNKGKEIKYKNCKSLGNQ